VKRFGRAFIAPEVIAPALAGLHARAGVFATLGNHDRWLGGQRIRSALERSGIKVLENDAVRVEHDGAVLWIAGISDLWTASPDITAALAKVTDGAPVIAFTHNPDIFPDMPARVALTIAGHTHGGQVVLPLVGRLVVPSRFGQRYALGHIVEGTRHLFVTTGIGTSMIPVRFGVPPEIAVLTVN
jgi:predicted MPP superfamily phosphohydrolase